MRKIFFLSFLFFTLIPLATAFDCSLSSDYDTCISIQDSELSDVEKEELYDALMYVEFPDFDYVYDYNTELEFDEKPDDVKKYGSDYIKNAWIILASVMPSVEIDNVSYYDGSASVLTGYDYEIEVPSGTASGDCKTIYNVNSISRSHRVYVNDEIIGYSDLVAFESAEDVEIRTELTITAVVSIRHYKIKTTKPFRGTCKYYSTETDTDTLIIYDSKELLYLNDEPSYSINIEDQGYDSYQGSLDVNDAVAYDFSIGEGSYQKRDWYYTYDITYGSLLNVVAVPYEREVVNNINFVNNEFTIQEIKPCSITLYSHFDSWTSDCEQDFEDNDISILTDKHFYDSGDEIQVTITPSDEEVLLTYGDIEKLVTGSTILTAEQSGLITISSSGKANSVQIYVGSGNWGILWLILLFGMFVYTISNFGLFIWRRII